MYHEQALVNVQSIVVEAALVLCRLSEHRPGLLLFLAAQGKSRTPQVAVKGHADGIETPGKFVSGGSQTAHTHLCRLRDVCLVLLWNTKWNKKCI